MVPPSLKYITLHSNYLFSGEDLKYVYSGNVNTESKSEKHTFVNKEGVN